MNTVKLEPRKPDPVGWARLPLAASILAVCSFLQGVKQVCCRVNLAIVLDLLVTFHANRAAIFQSELVGGVFQVLVLDQYALEGFRVEAEGGAALESLLVGVHVDVLEL